MYIRTCTPKVVLFCFVLFFSVKFHSHFVEK